ncbi:hypothetical protein CQ009_18335 [Pseudomonas sp. MYb2]|uniref:DUF4381 domain-containing protein n=1 Tax=unclassified Pseudomonas TaxID=196821 RepID=UPI000CFE994D|nr:MULTISPECIES: DUF4381 domain-containing protein [unclassified Pseudomonas]PRB47050.1 hypothetical protein CQ025_18370 [Pseudomonas sp. MYb3]PRC32378.1 hypothetical protein CQ009_18335 [Pseudomonas sp. MYb2]
MNPNIPSIEQLKELGLPAPVSYAPQTWGWWVLLALLILAALLIGIRRYWQWRRDAYRREGLARLAQLRSRSDDLNALRELPELLKRVALSMPTQSPSWNPISVGVSLLAIASSRSTHSSTDRTPSRAGSLLQGPAALGREDWQDFLQRHCKKPLPADFSEQLAQLAYAPDETLRALPAPQRQALFETCQYWMEHHHVAA